MSVRAWRYTSIFCCIIRCTLYTPLTTIYKPKVYSIGAPHVRDELLARHRRRCSAEMCRSVGSELGASPSRARRRPGSVRPIQLKLYDLVQLFF